MAANVYAIQKPTDNTATSQVLDYWENLPSGGSNSSSNYSAVSGKLKKYKAQWRYDSFKVNGFGEILRYHRPAILKGSTVVLTTSGSSTGTDIFLDKGNDSIYSVRGTTAESFYWGLAYHGSGSVRIYEAKLGNISWTVQDGLRVTPKKNATGDFSQYARFSWTEGDNSLKAFCRHNIDYLPEEAEQNAKQQYIDLEIDGVGNDEVLVVGYGTNNQSLFELKDGNVLRIYLSYSNPDPNKEGYHKVRGYGDISGLSFSTRKLGSTVTVSKINDGADGANVSGIGSVAATLGDGTVLVGDVDGNSTSFFVPQGKTVVFAFAIGDASTLWTFAGFGSGRSGTYTISNMPDLQDTEVLCYVRKKPLYSFTVNVDGGHGSGEVTEPSAADEDGKYAEGRKITVKATPSAGYELSTVEFLDAEDRLIVSLSSPTNTFSLNSINTDTTARIVFSAIDYAMSVEKDGASASAITKVSVANTEKGESTDTARASTVANYADVVKFEASVASGYSFAGWYDKDTGELVSTDNPYFPTYLFHSTSVRTGIVGPVSLVAKAQTTATLGMSYAEVVEGERTCSIAVNGAAYTPDAPIPVILGESFTYTLTLGELAEGENWVLDSWREDPEDSETILQYPLSGTISPTAPFSMVACITSATLAFRTVSVYVVQMNADGQGGNAVVDRLELQAETITITGVPASEAGGYQPIPLGGAGQGGGASPLPWSMDVCGTQYVYISAAITAPFAGESDPLVFFGFGDSFSSTGVPEVVTKQKEISLLLTSESTVLYAYYGSAQSVTISLDYVMGSDSTYGSFLITGKSDTAQDSSIAADGLSATAHQGSMLYLSASANNGFKFEGWFDNPYGYGEKIGEPGLVLIERTIYAKFSKYNHSICEWEGGTETKAMVWRSKTYEASKPFNPSACRVDALGYAGMPGKLLELTVDMFSAPNTAATATTRLTNIANQNARRLPVMRPERYIQVEVKANAEVDALLVGTSMGGLAQ